LGTESRSSSRAVLTRLIRHSIGELVNKKIQPLLIIDKKPPLNIYENLETSALL
jgi:hypothetical protein